MHLSISQAVFAFISVLMSFGILQIVPQSISNLDNNMMSVLIHSNPMNENVDKNISKPYISSTPLQGSEPLQSSGPLQGSTPLQNSSALSVSLSQLQEILPVNPKIPSYISFMVLPVPQNFIFEIVQDNYYPIGLNLSTASTSVSASSVNQTVDSKDNANVSAKPTISFTPGNVEIVSYPPAIYNPTGSSFTSPN
jgi:hypothetical protein